MGALGKDNSKNSMGAAAGLVHVGGSHGSGEKSEALKGKVRGFQPLCLTVLPPFLPTPR